MEVVLAVLIALVVGLGVGLLSGMLGIGGGTILVPVFRLGFGMPPLACTATSLFTIIPTSLSGALTHFRARTCIVPLGVAAGLAGALTSPVGVWLASISPDWGTMVAAAAVVLYSSITMFKKALSLKPAPDSNASNNPNIPNESTIPNNPNNPSGFNAPNTPGEPDILDVFSSSNGPNAFDGDSVAPGFHGNVSRETNAERSGQLYITQQENSWQAGNVSRKANAERSGQLYITQQESHRQAGNVSRETKSSEVNSTVDGLTVHEAAARGFAMPKIGGRKLAIGAVIGLGAGLMSGYVGVGGGFIMVPLFMQLLGTPMKLTSGTSLIAVMILAVPGVISQALLGNVDWLNGIMVSCGSIPGAIIGSRLMSRIPERTLRFIFAGFLLVAAAMLVLNQLHIV